MTLKQKNKIAIAEDVIAQIKARKFKPTCGIYVDGTILEGLNEGDDLQAQVQDLRKGQPCGVCAIGAAFLSCVNLNDGYEIHEADIDYNYIDDSRMRQTLEKFFSEEELSVIESSFECKSDFLYDIGSNDLADEFENSFDYVAALEELDETARLLWIMQSVINLNGDVSLEGFKQQMLLALAIDPKFAGIRKQLNW